MDVTLAQSMCGNHFHPLIKPMMTEHSSGNQEGRETASDNVFSFSMKCAQLKLSEKPERISPLHRPQSHSSGKVFLENHRVKKQKSDITHRFECFASTLRRHNAFLSHLPQTLSIRNILILK